MGRDEPEQGNYGVGSEPPEEAPPYAPHPGVPLPDGPRPELPGEHDEAQEPDDG